MPGPFDAWRVGFLETPVRIYDISLGGCFVHAMHEQERGVVVMLKIQLPDEGWIELKAETLYRRPGFGFGVQVHRHGRRRRRPVWHGRCRR